MLEEAVKLSYHCSPNMGRLLENHNKPVLSQQWANRRSNAPEQRSSGFYRNTGSCCRKCFVKVHQVKARTTTGKKYSYFRLTKNPDTIKQNKYVSVHFTASVIMSWLWKTTHTHTRVHITWHARRSRPTFSLWVPFKWHTNLVNSLLTGFHHKVSLADTIIIRRLFPLDLFIR